MLFDSCPGGEWDSVIYIGHGDTEVFSRARLTLGIITINSSGYYELFKNILIEADKQEPPLLRLVDLV